MTGLGLMWQTYSIKNKGSGFSIIPPGFYPWEGADFTKVRYHNIYLTVPLGYGLIFSQKKYPSYFYGLLSQ